MTELPIYLDYAAATPLDPRVAQRMSQYLTQDAYYGNSVAGHYYGKQVSEAIAVARQEVADLVGADPGEIIWTSGATESVNLAIKGVAEYYQDKGRHIITCKTEHKSGLGSCQHLEKQGFSVTYLMPLKNGLLDLDEIAAAITSDTILISIMHVNNETGVIQDIAGIGALARAHKILFHVDAAQSAGKVPINLRDLPVDLLSLSAHKMYGPKGMGALFIRHFPRARITPQLDGARQEQGFRSGTLPTHQIIGMGEACRIAALEMVDENKKIKEQRDKLWAGLQTLHGVYLNGDEHKRAPGILNISVADVEGGALQTRLRERVAVSSGAACNSMHVEPSHVLKALGMNDALAYSAIRFSVGRFTTDQEIDAAIIAVHSTIEQLRSEAPVTISQ